MQNTKQKRIPVLDVEVKTPLDVRHVSTTKTLPSAYAPVEVFTSRKFLLCVMAVIDVTMTVLIYNCFAESEPRDVAKRNEVAWWIIVTTLFCFLLTKIMECILVFSMDAYGSLRWAQRVCFLFLAIVGSVPFAIASTSDYIPPRLLQIYLSLIPLVIFFFVLLLCKGHTLEQHSERMLLREGFQFV